MSEPPTGLQPTGSSEGLAGIEVWGIGAGSAPRDAATLAAASAGGAELPFDNAFVIPGVVEEADGGAEELPDADERALFEGLEKRASVRFDDAALAAVQLTGGGVTTAGGVR